MNAYVSLCSLEEVTSWLEYFICVSKGYLCYFHFCSAHYNVVFSRQLQKIVQDIKKNDSLLNKIRRSVSGISSSLPLFWNISHFYCGNMLLRISLSTCQISETPGDLKRFVWIYASVKKVNSSFTTRWNERDAHKPKIT